MALRRKYKINEEDLDQIPGKNRKRKKKRQSTGVREAPTGRSAGSGPNVKTLDPDTYDHRICGICLAPMEPAFQHSRVKPVVPLVADAAEQLMLLETLMKSASISTSISTSVPFSSSTSESAPTDTAASNTVNEIKDGNNENTAIEITFDCDIPEVPDRSVSTSASQTNTSTNSRAATSVTCTEVEVIDLTSSSKQLQLQVHDLSSSSTSTSSSSTFFHRLVCVGCGVNVHLGCVHETGGATSPCFKKGK